MKRAELEHVIRAASGITRQPDLVVVGSQAVLAQFPDAPAALLSSMEADNLETLAERVAILPVPSDRLELMRERLRRLQAAP